MSHDPLRNPDSAPDRPGEHRVREMYERTPYPDLGAALKNPGIWLDRVVEMLGATRAARPLRYLDAGCGTGHSVVAVAKRHANWNVNGLDLSESSLAIARQLAAKHDATVTFARGSYLDALPIDGPFDVIASLGSIHHCEDPEGAIRNLLSYLADDGLFVMHLYGKDLDRGKFEIREVLDILEPDLGNIPRRFALYESLMDKRSPSLLGRLINLSPRVVLRALRDVVQAARRRARGESWSPSWREGYPAPTAPWIDHFCHPLERSYNVRDVQTLAEAAGLEVIEMLNQGRQDLDRLPSGWRSFYDQLDHWRQWRLMELLDNTARSVMLIGRKAQP